MATETITVNVGGQPSITVAVEVEQVSGTAPPDFVATLRGLSPGDDTPINSYATDLDTYVADIDEAQDLLDAAQAVGDVATAISKLGASGITTYASLAAVIAAALAEGSYWRLAWTSDTYHGTGEVIGQIVGGYPSWVGPIPWSVVGTAVSNVTSTHTTDADGRPQLVVTGDGSTTKVCDLGLDVPPFATVRLYTQYAQATRNNTGATGPTLLLARTTSSTSSANSFWMALIPQASGWRRYHYDDWTASGTDAAITGASDTMWAGGGALVFGMRTVRGVSATPARYPLLKALAANEQSFEPGNVPAGAGSWLTASNTYRVRMRLRDTGGAATLTTTGLEITM